MKNSKFRLFIYFLFFILLTGCHKKKEVRRVIVIHSYEKDYIGYASINKEIIKNFQERGIEPDIHFFYLDCESYNEDSEITVMNNFLESQKKWNPEIILVYDDQATYTLLKSEKSFEINAPIVFGGVNYPNWNLIKQHSNVVGFHDKIGFKANIDLAKQLFGKDIRLFSLMDFTFLDRQIRKDAQKQLKGQKVIGFMTPEIPKSEQKRLYEEEDYDFFIDTPTRASDKGVDLLWSLSKYLNENCHIQLKRDFTTVNMGRLCASPSLTAINEGFCYGEQLLGGYMTTVQTQVEETVDAAVFILHGAHPKDLGIKESRKEYVMDWEAMQQRNISITQVPQYCRIIGIPFKNKYPELWHGIVITSCIVIVLILLCLLYLYRREFLKKRKAQYALQDEQETLTLAIEGGNTFVWKLEKGLFILEKKFWDAHGVENKSLTLDELTTYVHPESIDCFNIHKERFLSWQKGSVQLLCNFNKKEYQWWEFRYTTMKTLSGETKTAGLLLNVQPFKDRESELEAARKLAEKAELKQSFLANMSHEIRTPLNAIVGFSNILISDIDISKEERSEYVGIINKNSDLLLKLINDILELSRIESGHMSFDYEKYLVSDVVNEVFLTHQMLMPKNINFIKEEDIRFALEINIDKGRLIQVLTNFLNNAAKFTPEGYIKLGYHYDMEENHVLIYVEDSGRGISPEEQKMIFSRFYKQDEFAQGAGLGLSICLVIIEKLKGTIELQSQVDKGSRFTIKIPCTLKNNHT